MYQYILVVQVRMFCWFYNIILLFKIKGIALLYLRLAILFPAEKDNYKSKAKSLIDSSLEYLKGKNFIV